MSKTLFRCVIAGSIAWLIASVVIIVSLDHPLPAALNAWVETEANAEWSTFDWFACGVAVVSIAASVGLFFFANWARHAYAASIAVITGSTLFSGPSVSTAVDIFFSDASLLVDGFIIGVAYFSDARHYFETRSHSNAPGSQ